MTARSSQPRHHGQVLAHRDQQGLRDVQPSGPLAASSSSRTTAETAKTLLIFRPMARSGPEVADIFRRYGVAYRETHGASLCTAQRRVMSAIELCRTAALGGHVERCDRCDHQRIAYNSCRDRHCPKCQSLARAQWLEDRRAELLETEYFHVVFTVPQEIAALAYQNKRVVYNILFRATPETLRTIAADPKHLGAEIGFLAVLHTWGQTLLHHPHLHCVVPGGGLSPDHRRWIPCGHKFFLPVEVLGVVFRGKFLQALERAFKKHKLTLAGQLTPLQSPADFAALLRAAAQRRWVVYAKRPFAGPAQVLTYLSRYTHRIAIANSRLVSMAEGRVTFQWRDYAHGHQTRTMTLEADEFLRRFLLHVLPASFVRIRYLGLLANRHRAQLLALCRSHLQTHAPPPLATAVVAHRCQHCHRGHMRRVEILSPIQVSAWLPDSPQAENSS